MEIMSDIKFTLLTEQDIELVRSWRNSPEISQFMYTDDYISEENQQKWFNKIKDDPSQKYWIIDYLSVKVGLISLNNINLKFKTCYWTFYLDRRGIIKNFDRASVMKSNISGKVEYSILNMVFEELGMNKLLCEVLVENKAVINMHEKLGFRRESYFREHVIKNNIALDVVTLAILKQEWEFLRSSIYKKAYESL